MVEPWTTIPAPVHVPTCTVEIPVKHVRTLLRDIRVKFNEWLMSWLMFGYYPIWIVLWIIKSVSILNPIYGICLPFTVNCKSDKSCCGKPQPSGYPASFCTKYTWVYFDKSTWYRMKLKKKTFFLIHVTTNAELVLTAFVDSMFIYNFLFF